MATGTNAATAGTNAIRIPAAATALKKLKPDVILLQHVTDWAMCQELAEALKPAKYNVVTCSAFRDGRSAVRKQQTAILAKATAKPYFSWSETWRSQGTPTLPGGFAFAAFQVGQRRIGVFSAQAAAPAMLASGKKSASPAKKASPANPATPQERLAATVDQLLAQVESVSSWTTNRLEAIVLGGSFGLGAGQEMALHGEPLQLLQEAGFVDAFAGISATQRTTVRGRTAGPIADYLFAQPGHCTTEPVMLRTLVSRRFPVTCDVQLNLLSGPLSPIKAPVSLAAAKRIAYVRAGMASTPAGTPAAPLDAPASAPAMTNPVVAGQAAPALPPVGWLDSQMLWIASTGVGLPALAAAALILARRRKSRPARTPALLSTGDDAPATYTVVMGTRSAAESSSPPPPPAASQPVIHIEAPGDTHTHAEALRRRVLAAEKQAERAQAIIRAGLIPDLTAWVKQKLAHKLITDRALLLETQQAATRQAAAVEQRLARIERQVQEQNRAYVERIEELTRELLHAKEENRELIRARIAQVKAEMAAARERLLAQEEAEPRG